MQTVSSAAPRVTTVDVVEVVKRYPLFVRRRDRALAFLGVTSRLAFKKALDRVSVRAVAGQAVGVIGENGSGKSTLLRLIAGISQPDSGTITVAQPVSAILELGLGFHPEFSGRRNAFLYGTVIGIPEDSMRARIDDIMAFADLREYGDQPVRTYSSGMVARLAFAVASHVQPAVLVVDEALAVGDGAFQRKCIDRMLRFKDEGRTVLFCSHSMYTVASFCEEVLWLRNGHVEDAGEPNRVIAAYEWHLRARESEKPVVRGPEGAALARVVTLAVVDQEARVVTALHPGEDYVIEAEAELLTPRIGAHFGVAFDSVGGECLGGMTTLIDGLAAMRSHSRWRVRVHLPQQPFSRGPIEIAFFVLDDTGLLPLAQKRIGPLNIVNSSPSPGSVVPVHRWELLPSVG